MTYPRCGICKKILRTFGDIATHRGHPVIVSYNKRLRIHTKTIDRNGLS